MEFPVAAAAVLRSEAGGLGLLCALCPVSFIFIAVHCNVSRVFKILNCIGQVGGSTLDGLAIHWRKPCISASSMTSWVLLIHRFSRFVNSITWCLDGGCGEHCLVAPP